jgi:predicted PurR-regulated permease PerM
VADFPSFRTKALSNIDLMESRIEEVFGITGLSIVDFLRTRVAMMFDAGNDFFNRLFTATAGTLFRFGILPVFIFMLLYYRTKFAHFILKLAGPEKKEVALKVLREVSKVASRYMGGIFTVVFVMCFLNSFGFILIGLKYAIVLGVMAAMFSFIPHFGSIIGYSMPFVFALLTGDSPSMALRVLLMLLVVQFLEHNILMPNIVGSYVKLNPFIIILGVIAGGMVWGIPGMFIVVPVLAVFRIIFINIDSLKPYGYLIGTGGMRRHALTAENIHKFMRRFRKG